MSFLRSVMRMKPFSSMMPISPVRSHPSGVKSRRGFAGHLPVARHHLRTLDADLAFHAGRQFAPLFIHNGDSVEGSGSPIDSEYSASNGLQVTKGEVSVSP